MIIVDTNVTSELMRPSPAPQVREWIAGHERQRLFTTSITLAEIRYGIERLPAGRRRDLLRATAEEIFAKFEDQVLAFDAPAAARYPVIVATRDSMGRPIDGFDAQIAAICRARKAMLATRNTKDFEDTGIAMVNPWQGQ